MISMRRAGTMVILLATVLLALTLATGLAAAQAPATPPLFLTNTAETGQTPGLDGTAPAATPAAPIDDETPPADEAVQWTAYLQQMTALLNGAMSWLAGLSLGFFVVVVLALLGAVLLIVRIARSHVPLPVFQTVEKLARETVTAVKDISERRLEEAKKTASPVDDAVFQITTTLTNLVLALVDGAQTQAAAALPRAGVNMEMARLQAQVAELQRQSGSLKSADEMAAERARMKYGTPVGAPTGMPQMPYTHTPGGSPLYGPGMAEGDGGIG